MLESVRRLWREARFLAQLRFLPPRVAFFQWRAWRHALRTEDAFALVSATRPRNLAVLLSLARGRPRIVELGTGSGWTAISLVLADQDRVVVSYDPIERHERERYLWLAGLAASRRLTFINAPGDRGPDEPVPAQLLYIDSSHDRDDTIREVEAWRGALGEGSLIIFDDFAHAGYPGVEEAVRSLGLSGEQRGSLFVHTITS
jgi:predicted O-methyltransferase YrrM